MGNNGINNKIVFVAPYPTAKTITEGMMQRIQHIDNCFSGYDRLYLNIRLYRGIKKEIKKEPGLTVLTLNLFTNFYYILKIFKAAETVYIHSVYNGLPALPFLSLIKTPRHIVLDLHGVVPEELEFEGQLRKSQLYASIEKHLIRKVSVLIHVTNAMKRFYEAKYKLKSVKNIVYSVKPGTNTSLDESVVQYLASELQLHENEVVFIYSGSAQKWQNTELMFAHIKLLTNPDYRHIILSGEPEKMAQQAKDAGINTNMVLIRSVKPDMLAYYYEISHYGFVLRDDHILNRVANPTKLTEYLAFGIIPIVKLEEIGDFKELGYEYICIDQVNNSLKKRKSEKNKSLAKQLMQDHTDLATEILSPSSKGSPVR